MLTLDGVAFQLSDDGEEEGWGNGFYVTESDKDDGTLDISLEAYFTRPPGRYGDRFHDDPSISLSPMPTGKKKLAEVAGMTFEVGSLKEADEREDTFYMFEHEPFENYKLTVAEIKDGKARIKCSGTAVWDSDARPHRTAEFEVECLLPVAKEDWEKYGF